MEAGFGGGVAVLSEGLHSVGRQVEIETVGSDLRSGHLESIEEERTGFRVGSLRSEA